MKKALFLLVLFITIQGFSQALNSYKYLIVPAKFEFQKQENQYGLNSLMEAYFKQQGFTVLYDKNMMKESSINPCDAIYANVIRENSMFNTRITVQLKNCEGKQLLVSPAGNSRSKEFDMAHKEAMRVALKSIPNQNYVFSENGGQKELPTIKGYVDNVKQIIDPKKEITKTKDLLTVETLTNGYLLIDIATSQVFLKLYNTSSRDIFIGTSNSRSGIVFRNAEKITFEYVLDNKVIIEILNVKLL